MFRSFFNTRLPSILTLLAFVACCLMFCANLAGARDSGELTPELMRKLGLWGSLAMACIPIFVLCLAQVTRYRRSLPDKTSQ